MTDRLPTTERVLLVELEEAKQTIQRLEDEVSLANYQPLHKKLFLRILELFLGFLLWKEFRKEENIFFSDRYKQKSKEIRKAGKARCGYCRHYKRNWASNNLGRCQKKKVSKKRSEIDKDPRLPASPNNNEGNLMWARESCRSWTLDPKVLEE